MNYVLFINILRSGSKIMTIRHFYKKIYLHFYKKNLLKLLSIVHIECTVECIEDNFVCYLLLLVSLCLLSLNPH